MYYDNVKQCENDVKKMWKQCETWSFFVETKNSANRINIGLTSQQPQYNVCVNHGNSRQRKKLLIQQKIIQNPTLLKYVHSDNARLKVNEQLLNQTV